MAAAWVRADFDRYDAEPAPVVDGWAVLFRALEDRRPAWQEDAACRGADVAAFFPDRGGDVTEAKGLCADCPVDLLCELYALELDTDHGIWAGESARKLKGSRTAA